MQRNIIDAKDVERDGRGGRPSAMTASRSRRAGTSCPKVYPRLVGPAGQWFRTGLDSGDLRQCDTFGTRSL
jgi:hypothetical protein